MAEIHAIKANALDRIGESECPQREAQYAYELLLKSEQFEAAKKNHQQFQHKPWEENVEYGEAPRM